MGSRFSFWGAVWQTAMLWVGDSIAAPLPQSTMTDTATPDASHTPAASKAARLLAENPDRWIWLEVRRHAGGIAWSFSQYLKQRPTSRNAAVIKRIAEAVHGIVEDAFMR